MRVTAHVILLLTAVLLLGADGPGGANPSATAPPKDAARPPMTREEAIDALKGLGVKVASAPHGMGVNVEMRGSPKAKQAMDLLPAISDLREVRLVAIPVADADLACLRGQKQTHEIDVG